MFCRNHLKNTSCDVGFLNKYYYQLLSTIMIPTWFSCYLFLMARIPDWHRQNYSVIAGRQSCRYPLRLPQIFWYFGNYRIRQELSFIFFPFGDLFGSSTKAVAGKIQKLQNRTATVLTSTSYDTSTDFYWINLARNISKHNVKLPKVPWCVKP